MGWRSLFLVIISCLASWSFVLSQDLSALTVYDEQGKRHQIHSVIKDSESFVVVKDAFCIGCAEYLVKCSMGKKVLVIVERFSLLSISNFQPIQNARLFFVSKSELTPDEFGTVGMAIIRNGSFHVIKEKEINQLSRNYQEGIKSMRKIVRTHFKSKVS
ncbi:hypothetical protein [Fluviicola chungangensis]|uniref:Uncharacterized protein n=1 Tax=Fluviicola chungangensis TaxID=2597671 RepID=A0A556N0P1_9FLAO|nr:hypothetical protein [Fluviicola chungangensis]TSJ45653.1 hypothetical protein FO442_07820 [Fluviicola chungangensis]